MACKRVTTYYNETRRGLKSSWILGRVEWQVVAKAVRSFEQSVTTYQSTQRNIPEDLNIHDLEYRF